MGRFLSRGVWVVAVLACAALIAWHLLSPGAVTAAAPEPTAEVTQQAEPFVGTGDSAAAPDKDALEKSVNKAIGGKPGTYHVAVQDVLSGETLVDRNAATPGTPASSLKLLTGAAALATFEHTHRFETTAKYSEDKKLFLVGGGDALLGTGESQDKAVEGHAGIKTLAKQAVKELKQQGASGDIEVRVDTSLFPGASLNPAWTEDLVTTNNITDVETPALNAGRNAARPNAPVVRKPADAALSAFVDALNQEAKSENLEAAFAAAGRGEAKDASTVATVESATLLEQLHYMESHSDNFMAETFGRLVAVARGATGSYEHAREQVTAAVKELGVDEEGLDMVDTSGLAASNQVSPSTLAGLLSRAAISERADLRELASLLPVAGSTGTLAGRLTGNDTKGLIRAKTGTLAAIISLSGYVTTQDGRLLSFSIMASDVQGALGTARGVADSIATELANYSAR